MSRYIFFLASIFVLNGVAVEFSVSNTKELRKALEDATANGADDTIILNKGVYKTTDDGVGTFKFSDIEAKNLTIKAASGLKAEDVVLDGNGMHQVLNLTNKQESTFYIEGLTIKNGKTSSSYGGGIYSDKNLTITNSSIVDNNSSYYESYGGSGGGAYSKNIEVVSSLVENNDGGGLVAHGILIVKGSQIKNNTTLGLYGGEMRIDNSSIENNKYSGIRCNSANISNSKVIGNYISGIICKGTVTANNSIISNNFSDTEKNAGYEGHGLYAVTVNLKNCTVDGNKGRGVYASSTLTLTNSSVTNNDGGGVYAHRYAIVINSLFSNNKNVDRHGKIGDGGAISSWALAIINSTIAKNTNAIYGNGLIVNSLFVDNDMYDITFDGDSKVYNNYLDYAKLKGESSYTIIKKNNLQPSDGIISFKDEALRLGDDAITINKGLNPTDATFKTLIDERYPIGSGYYINKENNATQQLIYNALKTDKDGNDRVAGGNIDMGAFENGSTMVCAQVITYAKNPLANECKSYATPCDVPSGWETKTKEECDTINTPTSSGGDYASGFEAGKTYCKNNPTLCDINTSSNNASSGAITKSHIESLKSGWSLVGTGSDMGDYSILDSASIVWTYKDGTWSSYAPTKDKSVNIKAFDGFWIRK